jgi:hypothetical protein
MVHLHNFITVEESYNHISFVFVFYLGKFLSMLVYDNEITSLIDIYFL